LRPEVLTRRYRAYLFDLDGTLLDTAPDINAALNAALAAASLPPVTEALTRHWVGYGSRVLLEEALKFHGVAERIANESEMVRLRDVFIDYYGAHLSGSSIVYPGVVEALDALTARGAHLGIVTNKYTQLSVDALKAAALYEYFDALVCGDTLPQRKPDPAPALHACKLLGATTSQTLFVGDSSTDVETARAAGCAVVCVRDGYNHGIPADQLGADAVIDSFLELL
jgi:phosphoglycolate phosphatase